MSILPRTPERRAFGRRESCIHGRIEVAGRPPVHCIVRNYSRGGALLQLSEAIGIDENLHLVIDSHDIAVYCDVRHRDGHTIGVRFAQEMSEEREARLATAPVAAPNAPIKGSELRRSLFGSDEPEPPVIVKPYRGPGIVLRP